VLGPGGATAAGQPMSAEIRTPRVLIVDDRRENLLALEATLRDMPFEVDTADSGPKALKKLLTDEYAVILLDAYMPGMDGFETAQLIKQRERTRNVPILFLTAGGQDPHLASRGYQAGAVDYLTKPLDPWILQSKIMIFAELWTAHAQTRALNAELQARSDQLAQSNRALEEFAYVASHDLQEPLRKVSSFCGLLRSRYGGKLDDRADQYIDFAIDGANRMSELIRDLLAFSRVTRDTQRNEPLDSQALLDAAVRNLSSQIEENEARVTSDTLPRVHGEASLITTVFQNLISNGIKFRANEPPLIHVSAARHEAMWRFEIQDNGIGVDPVFADKIFTIFQRLHRKEAYPGTGIGLALCRKIVEYHGGTIWLAPGTGTGTRFCFTLPAVEPTR
jgi:signal transduction histidine kinase